MFRIPLGYDLTVEVIKGWFIMGIRKLGASKLSDLNSLLSPAIGNMLVVLMFTLLNPTTCPDCLKKNSDQNLYIS